MSDNTIVLEEPFQPLLSAAANEYFETLLTPDSIVCEYGAGKGTVWLAQRVKKVITIEHDLIWFHAVKSALDKLNLEPDLRLISLETEGSLSLAEEKYTTFLLQFPDDYFDIIYLDGWRPSRIMAPSHAKSKVKPLGWIVVDNLEWHPVDAGVKLAGIDQWNMKRFQGEVIGFIPGVSLGPGICHTGFYQRPEITNGEA